MTKQTAVEWLIEQIKEYDFSPRDNTYLIEIPSWILKERIEKAKEMEKEQHGKTWDEAINAHENRGHNISRSLVDFDNYYNNN